jgi:hypothetical protein
VDFLRIVRSLEELLYEAMTWLVFYPRTMWRVVAHPAATMRYSDAEQRDTEAERYTDTLSPPLFLMLTILLSHGIGLALGAKLIEARTAAGQAIFGTQQNLLIMRSILMSVFPLVAATAVIKRRALALDRNTLRAPFFSQCYPTAPFVFVVSLALAVGRRPEEHALMASIALAAVGTAWYVWVESSWFRHELALTWGRAWLLAVWTVLKAAGYCLLLALCVALLI